MNASPKALLLVSAGRSRKHIPARSASRRDIEGSVPQSKKSQTSVEVSILHYFKDKCFVRSQIAARVVTFDLDSAACTVIRARRCQLCSALLSFARHLQ